MRRNNKKQTKKRTAKEIIKVGKARDLLKENFNIHPQCLIVTGKMHFIEEDFLKMF